MKAVTSENSDQSNRLARAIRCATIALYEDPGYEATARLDVLEMQFSTTTKFVKVRETR